MASDRIVEGLLRKYGLTIKQRLTTEHSGAMVLQCSSEELGSVVIKISMDERSRQEIRANKEGYSMIRSEGIEQILPDLLIEGQHDGVEYLLMTDLGENFMEAVRNAPDPVEKYHSLCSALGRLYRKTLREDDQSRDSVSSAFQLLLDRYEKHLMPNGLVPADSLSLLYSDGFLRCVPSRSSFACFDFTPEDIFLQAEGLKYPDPKNRIRGLPIIDLACFSGVCLDSYALPGSEEGYHLIRNFAIGDVAEMFFISSKDAEKLFSLGRALQLAISSKVRIGKDPLRAKEYAEHSVAYLSKIER